MNSERIAIEDGIARALFVTAWAQTMEETGKVFPAGSELMNLAPETTELAVFAAYRLAGRIEQANGMSLPCLLQAACKADGINYTSTMDMPEYDYVRDFGHYLAMEAMGHGVSWFDDHETFLIEIPDFETPMIDELGMDFADTERSNEDA